MINESHDSMEIFYACHSVAALSGENGAFESNVYYGSISFHNKLSSAGKILLRRAGDQLPEAVEAGAVAGTF